VTAILADQVRKAFGSVVALEGVSLDIQRGEFYGLLGPNGAGKTTMLRVLSGLLRPDRGTVSILGKDPADRNAARSLGVVPQEIALYGSLSARTNLEVFGTLCGLRGRTLHSRVAAVLETVGLEDRASRRVKTFSGGMKRRLNLAVGLLHDPEILLLDEPTVGVDPQSRARIFSLLQELNAAGRTILYTTHYMEEAERLCRRIGILDHGHLLAEGTLPELLAQVKMPRLVRLYGSFDERSAPQFDLAENVVRADRVEYIPRRAEDLSALVARLEASGTAFDRLEIAGPTLETLFLQLTGKELRD
jgi:ABC-2 type transport system ATP-binding protein